MDLKEHTTPEKLERYAFLWSEARLALGALALLIGGIPPALFFIPISGLYPLIILGLKLAWLISGAAAGYLLYRWYGGGQTIFGGNDTKDTVAFMIMNVTGINLGLTGLLGQNIGMTLFSGRVVFALAGIIYIATGVYLYQRWKANKERLFGVGASVSTVPSEA
jgi:uncharacterized membrane protein YuzA (DUF378 family)